MTNIKRYIDTFCSGKKPEQKLDLYNVYNSFEDKYNLNIVSNYLYLKNNYKFSYKVIGIFKHKIYLNVIIISMRGPISILIKQDEFLQFYRNEILYSILKTS